MTPAEIVKRFEELFHLRKSSVESTWDDIEYYISPIRTGNFFQEKKTETEIRHERPEIFDTTAIWGLQVLAASMHSSLTSPAIRWFRFGFKGKKLRDNQVAKRWLEDCSDAVFNALQSSNFNSEMSTGYQDLGGFGNTCLSLEQEDDTLFKGLDFGCIPIGEFYFEYDHKSKLSKLFRRYQWTIVQIAEKFGEKNLPDRLKGLLQGDRDIKHDVIYCVFKRKGKFNIGPKEIVEAKKRPVGTLYVLRNGAEQLGEEGGYYEMPAFVARWERTSGSQWGHGPGSLAIPSVRYLNTFKDTELSAAEKAVEPSMLAEERGLISDLDLSPGGLTTVRSLEMVKPMDVHANFQVSYQTIQDERAQIRQIFRTDDLQLKESPAMTATEVQVRYELMQRILGSTVARLQSDLLDPLISRAFKMMFRAGALPEVPPSLQGEDDILNIEYQGPLMRGQRASEVAGIERLLGLVNTLAQNPAMQSAGDLIDPAMAVREIADRLGVPASIIRSPDEVAKIIAQRQAAQQAAMAQQQAETAKTQAEAAATGQPLFDEAHRTSPFPGGGSA